MLGTVAVLLIGESLAQNPAFNWSIPRTMLTEFRRRISAAISVWDCVLLTFIYPGFDCDSSGDRNSGGAAADAAAGGGGGGGGGGHPCRTGRNQKNKKNTKGEEDEEEFEGVL